MRVSKQPFGFFTAKYKILQLPPSGHAFFTAKSKVLKTVLEWPFVYLQQTQKFKLLKLYTAIRSFNYEIRNF